MNEISPEDIRRCQSGDPQGLDAAFRAYGVSIYRVCLGILGGAEDAEDATQEVFVRVFEQARKFSGKSRFSTWLYRLATNHCLNTMKVRKRRSLASLSEVQEDTHPSYPGCSPLQAATGAEQREIAHDLLGRLPPLHRSVLVLREFLGLTYTEAAEVLDLPIGTVMSRLSRARENLAEVIRDYRLSHSERRAE